MSFRFRRRIKIAPGINLNLSKSGISTSAGPRGAKLNFGKRGKRMSVGIPGTGIYYTKQLGTAHGGLKPAKPINPILSFFAGLIVVSAVAYWLF